MLAVTARNNRILNVSRDEWAGVQNAAMGTWQTLTGFPTGWGANNVDFTDTTQLALDLVFYFAGISRDIPPPPPPPDSSKSGISAGIVAGVVIGLVVFTILVVIIVVKRRHKKKNANAINDSRLVDSDYSRA
jgi:hypothetical protein